MKMTFLDSCHMLYGNKGAVWTNSVHICETGLFSSTLCGVPMEDDVNELLRPYAKL